MNHNASFLAAKSRGDEYVELLQNNPVEFWIQQVEISQGGSNGPTIKLRAAVEAMSKDGARYRWLRDVAMSSDWESIANSTTPSTTDAVIDACMGHRA